MDAVTDVMAFAARNSEYWTEFLGANADYGDILSPEELRAIEAARRHIEDGIYALLVECGTRLAARLEPYGVAPKAFQRGPALKKRGVFVPPPSGSRDLYRFEFEFAQHGGRVLLFGSLVVKIGVKDQFAQKLAERSIDAQVDGAYVYLPGVPLDEGALFTEIGEKAALQLDQLFAVLREVNIK